MVRPRQIPTEIKHEGNHFDTSTHHRRLGRGLDRQCRVDGRVMVVVSTSSVLA